MNTDITENSILSLKKGVALRYEHNFNGGTTILIDTFNDKLWFGNADSLILIKQLRNNTAKSVGEIYSAILTIYNATLYNKVINALNEILNDLLDKNFLEIIE